MKESQGVDFINLMQGLCSLYGQNILPDEKIKEWFDLLSSFEIDDIGEAMKQHAKHDVNGRFFPKPIDIIRLIGFKNRAPSAELAWCYVKAAHSTPFSSQKVTKEMLAAYGVVKHLLKTDNYTDTNIAFKAFKEKYEELIRPYISTDRNPKWFTLQEFEQQRIEMVKLENAKKPMIKDARVTKDELYERSKLLSELAKALKQSAGA